MTTLPESRSTSPRRSWRAALTLGLVGVAALTLSARAASIPPALVCNIVLKVLAMDTGLQERSGGKLVITVVGDDEIYKTFTRLKGAKIGSGVELVGVVRADSVPMDKPGAVLFAGAASDPRAITAFSREHKLLTVTNVPDYVVGGVTLGIGLEAGKPKVLLNLSAAAEEAIDFKAQLLKLAKTIR